jgi:hypothetical protein
MAQIDFNDKDSSNNTLSIGDVNAIKSVVNQNEGLISNGSVSGHFDSSDSFRYNTHFIPESNADFDFGSAEYKVRHLFLSDNSIWLGDSHKIDASGGVVKSKKRDKTVVPSKIYQLGGDEDGARNHAGVANTSDLTLGHLELYAQSINPNITLGDLFPPETDNDYTNADYEKVFEQSDRGLWSLDKLQGGEIVNMNSETYIDISSRPHDRIVINNDGFANLNLVFTGIPQTEHFTLETSVYIKNMTGGTGGVFNPNEFTLAVTVQPDGEPSPIIPQSANYQVDNLRDGPNIIDVRLMYYSNTWISFVSNNIHSYESHSITITS